MGNSLVTVHGGPKKVEPPLSSKEEAEFRRIYEQDPWEAVFYLAGKGREQKARELQNRLVTHKDLVISQKDQVINELKEKLEAEFMVDGVLLGGPVEDEWYIVGVGGGRYAVKLAIEPNPSGKELAPGRAVWVHAQTKEILKLRDTYFQGEVVPVIEVMDSTEGTSAAVFSPFEVDQAAATSDRSEHVVSGEGGLPDVPRTLLKVACHQEEIIVEAMPDLARADPPVSAGDRVRIIPGLGAAVERVSQGQEDVLLAEVPDVDYEHIGGLDGEITKIKEAIEAPYIHAAIFERYDLHRPRGILLYGPPGCGKTMIAKAIANNLSRQIARSLRQAKAALELYARLQEKPDDGAQTSQLYKHWREMLPAVQDGHDPAGDPTPDNRVLQLELVRFLADRGIQSMDVARTQERIESALKHGSQSYFISIKGPELLSKWVGEAESNIRGIFTMARERATFHTPVILFFDEIESLFSRRGSGISSDVQKTIVPQLLAEMDGIEEMHHVVVIGATNRFDLIDPAVLRPGRLDFKIKIPRPNRNREAPRSVLLKYLTPAVPFPVAELAMPAQAQDTLGQAAAASSLSDCLQAAMDDLAKVHSGFEVALFLTDLYANNHPPVREVNLWATAGIVPDKEPSVIENWGQENSIAWQVVRSGEKGRIQFDASAKSISAWPILAPDRSDLVWGVLVVAHSERVLPENVDAHIVKLLSALRNAILARRDYAEHLTERTLDILFDQRSRLLITELVAHQRNVQEMRREPRKLEKHVWEIISGAMLESVVSRAKRVAVQREIRSGINGTQGMIWYDLYQAIRLECEESKDQYIQELFSDELERREQAYFDTERFHIDVRLPPADAAAVPVDPLARGERDVTSSDKVPDIAYEDIGGLDEKIDQIRDAIETPYLHPTVYQRYGLQRPRGILLYGPPGCGKTMIAKAIANNLSKQIEQSRTEIRAALKLYLCLRNDKDIVAEDPQELYREWKSATSQRDGIQVESEALPKDTQEFQAQLETFLSSQGIAPVQAAEELREIDFALEQGIQSYFISVKGPEILSKWVGESESTIRGIFARARDRATFYTPVVLFFDEIESLFSRRGSGISSDMQATIVPQLLAELDGVEEMRHIVVIGASNRFDLIDPAVLRPGRFDYKIEIPRPGREASRAILRKYLTADVPFPPTKVTLPETAQQVLGTRAAQAAVLSDCLTVTIDEQCEVRSELRVALFLTDRYAAGAYTRQKSRPPVRELSLQATGGIAPSDRQSLVDTWIHRPDGIAWQVVTSCQRQTREIVPESRGDNPQGLGTSAWPILSPNDPNIVWGVLVVEYSEKELAEQDIVRFEHLARAVADAIQARRTFADHLIERLLDTLFHNESHLIIAELLEQPKTQLQQKRQPRTMEKSLTQVLNGAMLESIVSRAKRATVEREIQGGEPGVTWQDLYQAIKKECDEGKDQYSFELYRDDPSARAWVYQDLDKVAVSVSLPPMNAAAESVTWLVTKPYAWRTHFQDGVPVGEGAE